MRRPKAQVPSEDIAALQHRFQHRAFAHRPLFEQVVLGMHPGRDLVTATLQDYATGRREVDADFRADMCVSSSVPLEPNRCGVRGYFTKSSRVAPMAEALCSKSQARISPGRFAKTRIADERFARTV